MEHKYFPLGINENNTFVKIIRILFGFACLVVAFYWLIINVKSCQSGITLWITIAFLSGFGLYQILSGLGRTTTYIEIGTDSIRLKKNPLLKPVEMKQREIEKIELFPLNVIFFLKSRKRILLRFSSSFYETNEKVKDEIILFAGSNNIPLEFIQEEL